MDGLDRRREVREGGNGMRGWVGVDGCQWGQETEKGKERRSGGAWKQGTANERE